MILFTVYQPVVNNIPSSGVGKVLFGLYNSMVSDGIPAQILFSSMGKLKSEGITEFPKMYKFVRILLHKCNRILPYYIIRFVDEIIYDVVLSLMLPANVNVHVTSNCWQPRTLSKLKKRLCKNVVVAGNPCDLYMKKLVRNEMLKIAKRGVDSYTFLPRLRRYVRSMEKVDVIIAINSYIRETYKCEKNMFEKTVLVKTFYDADYSAFRVEKKLPSDKFVVFYCAHSVLLKGLHLLMQAVNRQKHTNIQIIVGGLIDKKYLKAIEALCPIPDTVRMVGPLQSKQIAEILSRSHVFVCPSICDAAPVAVIEAMYSGTPVICSTGVGNSWLVEHRQNGFLYSYDRVDELAGCLEECVIRKDDMVSMGVHAKKTILEMLDNKAMFQRTVIDLITTDVL